MPSHIERWGTIGSMEEWVEHIDVLRDFAADRSRHMQSHLMRQFELDGYGKVSISSMNTDEFSINSTAADDLIDQWTGRYNVGQTIQLDFRDSSITASSSDSSVASVDDEWNISLSSPGHAEITFTDAEQQPMLVLDIEVLEVPLEKLSVEALEQQISLPSVSDDATWISNNTDSIEIINNEQMMVHEAGMSTVTAFNEEDIEAIYYVDAYEIADVGDQLDGQSGAIELHGTHWYEMASDNQVIYNEHPDDSLTFTFRGESFSWYGYSERIGGKADIYINGDFVDTIDTYNSTDQRTQLLFESGDLTGDEHHVEIFVRNSNERSAGNRIVVESIEIH
ncbi:hypothetical protein [Geomicrobium sp. JCM 19055]|uniref:hypothetical protein n=1 Tax=Geomicrobium sp. JCM 19055 TaxID=1460649 RepID=UPI00045EDD7D|nr:hypothetical protein [Geomicrobium sp. JCM 19055]GAJ97504.1 hypothetical protein JCM19055_366 [Geomicrobium sp. JCM 19055]